MNSTTVVAIAGILGTLLAPYITGRVQRRLVKVDRVLDRRIDAYADLLDVTRQIRENAQFWSAVPLAHLQEPPINRIRALDARICVVGSDQVREATDRFARASTEFYMKLGPARQRDAVVYEAHGDSVETIADRMGLGKVADELKAIASELESIIQVEMRL
jgi:hypothetical protein